MDRRIHDKFASAFNGFQTKSKEIFNDIVSKAERLKVGISNFECAAKICKNHIFATMIGKQSAATDVKAKEMVMEHVGRIILNSVAAALIVGLILIAIIMHFSLLPIIPALIICAFIASLAGSACWMATCYVGGNQFTDPNVIMKASILLDKIKDLPNPNESNGDNNAIIMDEIFGFFRELNIINDVDIGSIRNVYDTPNKPILLNKVKYILCEIADANFSKRKIERMKEFLLAQ
ncbi:MAG: hypothetical protein LBI69_01860 [Puniceicoccales bacterium]|jgi:hypothetical protein|nr:hypothetical protein [Puniceicoccales bacterium]